MFKKILSLLTCAILVFTSTTVMATTTKPTKKTATKKVTTAKKVTAKKPVTKKVTTTKKTTVKPTTKTNKTVKQVTIKTGNLHGAITYQQNVRVGAFNSNETKIKTFPDCYTVAYLINKTFTPIEKTKDWWTYGNPDKELGIGVYVSIDHGKGIYNFNNIPEGNYVLIVHPGKARNLQKTLSTECPDVLKNFFLPNTYSSFISSLTVINKHALMKVFEVTIKANQTTTLDYEFSLDD
jgi:hypothetical protein